MIRSLRGNIIQLKPWELILEAGHVGYYIKITLDAYEQLKGLQKQEQEQEIVLHTRVIYRETEQSIYGFLREKEAELFDFLRSLQGVGPQLANNMISTLGVENLVTAIENQDTNKLMNVPKVGKNIAGKILFEARTKQKKLDSLITGLSAQAIKENLRINQRGQPEGTSDFDSQLEEALLRLGFHKKEIDRASEKIRKDIPAPLPREVEKLQDWIRLYLRFL